MKGSSTLVASMVAASTLALSSAPSSSSSSPVCGDDVAFKTSSNQVSVNRGMGKNGGWSKAWNKEKFEPRFDGLKFIETLITAHR